MVSQEALNERSAFASEALQKAAGIVEKVGEPYREAALPIILQYLISEAEVTDKVVSSPQGQKQQGNPSEPQTKLPANLSVNEFFQKAAPDTHVGRFVCAAFYSFHSGKAEQVTQADILEVYGKLRIKKPQNPADVLNQCVKKVYLIDAPASMNGQRAWVITPTGEKYVEDLLNGDANSKK